MMEADVKQIELSGRIDSNNASEMEKTILSRLEGEKDPALVLDASGLHYISSAGLRVILRLKKSFPGLRIVNVNSEVYEVLDMTGFTQMMPVEKAFRVISVEGCEEIGRGANGALYRIGQDTAVKVYLNGDALADIRHEREVAKLALILGIPTAISYDVVKVGSGYGAVFELLDARSFSAILASEPEKLGWCVREYVELLKKIHATPVPAGKLPDMRETGLEWARRLQDHLPRAAGEKLLALAEAIPHDDHMIHGDYHTKNLMLQNGEVLLIDMDTLAVGHPIFELGSIYNAFVGFYELDYEAIREFQGFDHDTGLRFWRESLAAYLDTRCAAKLREVENKARILGYARLLCRAYRKNRQETAQGRSEIALWTGELLELLEQTETLTFSPDELEIPAAREHLSEVQTFVTDRLERAGCARNARLQIGVAVEEVFMNAAGYAPDRGQATLRVEVTGDPVAVTVTLVDHGVPCDPLASSGTGELPTDGDEGDTLGMVMTKLLMDDVAYEYRDGRNILTLKKKL